MKRLITFVLTILFLCIPVVAQEVEKGKIAGAVIDANSQEPVAGVNVEIKGTYMGAATDINGQLLIL